MKRLKFVGSTAKELLGQEVDGYKVIDVLPLEEGFFLTLLEYETGSTYKIKADIGETVEFLSEQRAIFEAGSFLEELQKL